MIQHESTAALTSGPSLLGKGVPTMELLDG
ncbi:uncharacterized protein METZ01_LOCUS485262 [marine metagenome]|uniref:Uncharacterized protein n=1 Tax=marine metagenome TaxID=408172 RepID=A0A383CLC5_9ZZZZ